MTQECMHVYVCTLPFGRIGKINSVVNVNLFIVGSLVNIAPLDKPGDTIVLSADDVTVDDGDIYELVGVGVEGHEVG